jgi:hypothetical protein
MTELVLQWAAATRVQNAWRRHYAARLVDQGLVGIDATWRYMPYGARSVPFAQWSRVRMAPLDAAQSPLH